MMKLYFVILAAAIVAMFLPVEYLVSDAFRPPPNKVLTPTGVKEVADTPLWLYPWRVTVVLVTLLFAAVVATFFTRQTGRVRWTLAFLSITTAVFHYLTLLFTSSPPGYGVEIYPLVYVIKVGNAPPQLYLDLGQILILYAAYNAYKARTPP